MHDKLVAKGWGIGIGLLLGIVLAILSLSKLPFIVGDRLVAPNGQTRSGEPLADAPSEPLGQILTDSLSQPSLSPPSPSQPSPSQSRGLDSSISLPQAARPAGVTSNERGQATLPKLSDGGPLATGTNPPLATKREETAALEEPHAAFLPPAPTQVRTEAPGEQPQELLKQARFLIKAGLGPMAADPLRKVVEEAPGTPAAQEAQRTLDSLSRN